MVEEDEIGKIRFSLASLGESVIAYPCGCKILKSDGVIVNIVLCERHFGGNPEIDDHLPLAEEER